MEKNYDEMSFKERKRLVITFLKKDGCFSAYKENIFKCKKNFSFILECSNPIAGAFIWSCTKQGHIFWEKSFKKVGKIFSKSTTHELKIRGFPCNLNMNKVYNMNKLYNKKKIFVKFLKENKCLSSFKRNYFKQKSKNHRNLNSIIKNNYPSVIDYSFTWDQTFEGQEFWSDMHYKWRHLLRDANVL